MGTDNPIILISALTTAVPLCISAGLIVICITLWKLAKRSSKNKRASSSEDNHEYCEAVGPVYETVKTHDLIDSMKVSEPMTSNVAYGDIHLKETNRTNTSKITVCTYNEAYALFPTSKPKGNSDSTSFCSVKNYEDLANTHLQWCKQHQVRPLDNTQLLYSCNNSYTSQKDMTLKRGKHGDLQKQMIFSQWSDKSNSNSLDPLSRSSPIRAKVCEAIYPQQ